MLKTHTIGIHANPGKLIDIILIQDLSKTGDSDAHQYVNTATISVDEYATGPTFGLIRAIIWLPITAQQEPEHIKRCSYKWKHPVQARG